MLNNEFFLLRGRILVFSPNTILAVRIKLDDGIWETCVQSDREHVYLHEWDPQRYGPGIHHIQASISCYASFNQCIKN